jgi:hypothetical protein
MNKLIPFLCGALGVASLAGCSSQMAYNSGQAWQRQECMKLLDAEQRQRCLASTATTYEDYRRQAEAAKGR